MRLGKHVRSFPALPLAAAQMAAMAVLSDAWLAVDVASAVTSGAAPTSVWEGCRYPHAALLYVLWFVLLPMRAPMHTGALTRTYALACTHACTSPRSLAPG